MKSNNRVTINKGQQRFCIAFFVPWITESRGGTENVGQMMANAMASRDHDVHIFTFDDERKPSVWPLADSIVLHHLETGDSSAADGRMLTSVAQVMPDLIVGLHMNRTFLRYVKCARKLGVPIVLSEHIDPRFPERLGTFSREERLIAFHGATRIHLLVEAFRATLPDHMQDKVRVIPNTVPPARNLADPKGNPKEKKTLVTVARLVPRKNILRLIEEFALAAFEVPEWQLQIIGDGSQMNELAELTEKLDIQRSVEFVGEISDPYAYLEQAHCFVLASLFEGFPMSSLEAMAHGLPIVGYDVCNGINVQVVHGENGLLVHKSSQRGALAQALLSMLSNDDLRVGMGTASLKRYEMLYSNKTVFNQWETLFIEAADDHRDLKRPELRTLLSAELDKVVFGGL
ncbi:MAG: glycosyltransferase [Myxococcota bacterium]|nr:glycosyltransferase [Myxococcota bacterium]